METRNRSSAVRDIWDTSTKKTYPADQRVDVVINKAYEETHLSCFYYPAPSFRVYYAWYSATDKQELVQDGIYHECNVDEVYPLQFFSELRSMLNGIDADGQLMAKQAIKELLKSKLYHYQPEYFEKSKEHESKNLPHDFWLLELLQCSHQELAENLSRFDARLLFYFSLVWVLREARKARGYHWRRRTEDDQPEREIYPLGQPIVMERDHIQLADWIEVEPYKHPFKTTVLYSPRIEQMVGVFPEKHREEFLESLSELGKRIDKETLARFNTILTGIRPCSQDSSGEQATTLENETEEPFGQSAGAKYFQQSRHQNTTSVSKGILQNDFQHTENHHPAPPVEPGKENKEAESNDDTSENILRSLSVKDLEKVYELKELIENYEASAQSFRLKKENPFHKRHRESKRYQESRKKAGKPNLYKIAMVFRAAELAERATRDAGVKTATGPNAQAQ